MLYIRGKYSCEKMVAKQFNSIRKREEGLLHAWVAPEDYNLPFRLEQGSASQINKQRLMLRFHLPRALHVMNYFTPCSYASEDVVPALTLALALAPAHLFYFQPTHTWYVYGYRGKKVHAH